MRAFVSVDDGKNLDVFLSWMRKNGVEVSEKLHNERYDMVVVNLPVDLPRSEKRLMKSEKQREAGILARAALHYEDMLPVCDPEDYALVMELFEKVGDVPKSVRRILSIKALLHSLEYMSRIHARLSELFGMVDYVHTVWKVRRRVLEKSYTEDYLSDLPERVFVGKERPLIPLYVFALNSIPKGSIMVFNRAMPIFASLSFEEFMGGGVLVYNGILNREVSYDLVVARGGNADVIDKNSDNVFISLCSEGVGYKFEVERDDLTKLERLALTFVFLSPAYTIAVFKNGRLIGIRFEAMRYPNLHNVPAGEILAVNFNLENLDCEKYDRVLAPSASEKVRRDCESKLLLRKV